MEIDHRKLGDEKLIYTVQNKLKLLSALMWMIFRMKMRGSCFLFIFIFLDLPDDLAKDLLRYLHQSTILINAISDLTFIDVRVE